MRSMNLKEFHFFRRNLLKVRSNDYLLFILIINIDRYYSNSKFVRFVESLHFFIIEYSIIVKLIDFRWSRRKYLLDLISIFYFICSPNPWKQLRHLAIIISTRKMLLRAWNLFLFYIKECYLGIIMITLARQRSLVLGIIALLSISFNEQH